MHDVKICTWPDGTTRKVLARKPKNGLCYIFWNDGKKLARFETVPVEWLKEPSKKSD